MLFRSTESMKLAASEALASLISEDELRDDYVIVDALDPRVKEVVAKAVAKAAQDEGVIRG